MFDISIKIANVLTIASILCYAAYLYSETKTAKYHIIAFFANALVLRFKPMVWTWKYNRINFWIYFIVPLLLGMGLILISQFYDGILRIRLDVQIILSAALWALMIIKEKLQYDLICKLYDTIKELKEKLSKYE